MNALHPTPAEVLFTVHDIAFELAREDAVRDWILSVVSGYSQSVASLSYIFCSDAYLLDLNRSHLDHDYYTDILTFPYHDGHGSPLWGEIFISVDRVRENAITYGVSFDDELHRVIVHGLLHLLGLDDHGEEAAQRMRAAEDGALARRPASLHP